jgi:putative membrane protein
MHSDPRVFFASERTLLAWVRTGIAIVGLGFVVSRFGLFLRVLAAQTSPTLEVASGHRYSNLIGMALVLLGATCMTVAAVQHGKFIAKLPKADAPVHYSRTFALWLSGMVTAASILLVIYLALTT